MKTILFSLGLALAVLTAGAQGNMSSGPFKPGAGAVTNDPLVATFAASNRITNPNTLSKLDKFAKKIRTMSCFTNFLCQFAFNQEYNPSNGSDFITGQKLTWNSEPSYSWGANLNLTNTSQRFVFSGQHTNWTVLMVQRNLTSEQLLPNGKYAFGCIWSLENSNTASFNCTHGGSAPVGQIQLTHTTSNALGYATAAERTLLQHLGLTSGSQRPKINFPCLIEFHSWGGTNIGYSYDTLVGTGVYTAGSTNLCNTSYYGSTNYSPIQFLTIGGSPNWLKYGATNSQTFWSYATNARTELFSVAVLNTPINSNDLAIYQSAIYELYPTKRHYVFLGDSMLAAGAGAVIAYGATDTNCIPHHFALRHPEAAVHNWAQGGAVIGGLATFPNLARLFPADSDVTLIHDFPRNDVMFTNTVAMTNILTQMATNIGAIRPYYTREWIWESTLPATNVTASSFTWVTNAATRFLVCSNLALAHAYLRTNYPANRFIHAIDVWNGAVWDCENMYYAKDAAFYGGGGVHVEGTNSPIYMRKMAAMIDTGEWPDTMPATQIQ